MKVLDENRLMLDENGDTSMRKNLSEEMIINDDISLGKNAEDQVFILCNGELIGIHFDLLLLCVEYITALCGR